MAYRLLPYDANTYGTEFFKANTTTSGTTYDITSYHGYITSTENIYCGLLRISGNNGYRYGTLMLSMASFSQRYTNTYSHQSTTSGTSTASLVTGYNDLYGYLVTDYNEAYNSAGVINSIITYVPVYDDVQTFIDEVYSGALHYPITYSYTNSTVSGPDEAAVSNTVTVSAVPDNNYGITDPESQILVTNNDVAVSYNWNPSTNTITFVMPDPS